MKSFIGCFLLQEDDQIKISNHKKEPLYLYLIRRIKNHRINIPNSSESNVTLLFESKEEKQQKNVSTLSLEGNNIYRVANEKFQSSQITISKIGIDDVQLFFTSDKASPHVFFVFDASQDQDIIHLNSIENDQNLYNRENSTQIHNLILNEFRRIKKSQNKFLLLCLTLHTFFPFSAFSRVNLKRIGKLDFWKILEKNLIVFYNTIKAENVLEEFKKCIDYIDFQITIDNDISFGIAFFIVTFLRFYQHQIFDLTKFFFFKRNFITFLTLLTFIPKPINETLFSEIMSYPLEPQTFNEQKDEIIISTLYQFILINCIKNKLKIYFHFSYLELFRKVVSTDEELDFILLNDHVIGIENFSLSKSLTRPKFKLSDPFTLDFKLSPFDEIVKKEKKSLLKIENNHEFEKNEVFKTNKVYNLWFKMKLNKKAKKHLCRYSPIYIKPNPDVEEDSKIAAIYMVVSALCLLFSVVIIWIFA